MVFARSLGSRYWLEEFSMGWDFNAFVGTGSLKKIFDFKGVWAGEGKEIFCSFITARLTNLGFHTFTGYSGQLYHARLCWCACLWHVDVFRWFSSEFWCTVNSLLRWRKMWLAELLWRGGAGTVFDLSINLWLAGFDAPIRDTVCHASLGKETLDVCMGFKRRWGCVYEHLLEEEASRTELQWSIQNRNEPDISKN